MHWDGTITLGTVLQIVAMFALAVAMFNALSARMSIFENALKDHAEKLGNHDESIMELVKQVARLIGASDNGRRRG